LTVKFYLRENTLELANLAQFGVVVLATVITLLVNIGPFFR